MNQHTIVHNFTTVTLMHKYGSSSSFFSIFILLVISGSMTLTFLIQVRGNSALMIQ